MAIRTKWADTELAAELEGSLDKPDLHIALSPRYVVLAKGCMIYVLDRNLPYDHDHSMSQFSIGPIWTGEEHVEEEHISALEWIMFYGIYRLIAIGTSRGYLLMYTTDGILMHRQLVYPGRILRLRARGTKRDIIEDTASSEDLCVVIHPGIIARFDAAIILSVVQRWYHYIKNRFWNHSSTNRGSEESDNAFAFIPYQLWNVSKYGSCVDAALIGVSPLVEQLTGDQYYCAVTIGADATISAFRLSKEESRSFVEVILSKVVPATISSIASLSNLVRRTQQPTKKSAPKPPLFAQALPLACLKDHLSTGDKLILSLGGTHGFHFMPLTDDPIKGRKLTLSPSGTLAAMTDSCGRIVLFDTRTFVVVRIWDGYWDASCLFLEKLIDNNSHGRVKNDYLLCLLIHDPHECIIETWQMTTGNRIATRECPKGSKMLQPTYMFKSTDTGSSSTCYEPLKVEIGKAYYDQLHVQD